MCRVCERPGRCPVHDRAPLRLTASQVIERARRHDGELLDVLAAELDPKIINAMVQEKARAPHG